MKLLSSLAKVLLWNEKTDGSFFLPYNERSFGVEQVPVRAEKPQQAEEEQPEVRVVRFRFRGAEFGQHFEVQDDHLYN